MIGESSFMKKSYKFIHEKRSHKRKSLENSISSFRLNGTLIKEEIITINISKSGLGFISKALLQTDDVVELFIPIPNSISIPITSKIVWKGFLDDTNTYGSEIIALPEHFKGFLFDYTDKK